MQVVRVEMAVAVVGEVAVAADVDLMVRRLVFGSIAGRWWSKEHFESARLLEVGVDRLWLSTLWLELWLIM